MRRKVDSRTVWSLTAIRNGKQENADEIDKLIDLLENEAKVL